MMTVQQPGVVPVQMIRETGPHGRGVLLRGGIVDTALPQC
jgi:hypothetical protein